nr:protein ALP1-like [Pelodiscus sinensis]XP_025037274.1 protein ALP1-like [Pelodiscus sinensis]|eukprot:XP_025037270.1 protein ALP1-like [Pelodiscus sinensis]
MAPHCHASGSAAVSEDSSHRQTTSSVWGSPPLGSSWRPSNSILLSRVIHLGDLDLMVAGFAAFGFPNCRRAINGTHIPNRAPQHQATQYMSRKGYFSMVLKVLVNHWGQFSDIFVGWSGWAHDACIFRNSSLYHKLEAGTFFPQGHFHVGDLQMSLCIIGNAAYPLMP